MDRLEPGRQLVGQERERREHEHEDDERLGDDDREHVRQDGCQGVADTGRREGHHQNGRNDQRADLQIQSEPPGADEHAEHDARDDDGEPDREIGHQVGKTRHRQRTHVGQTALRLRLTDGLGQGDEPDRNH